MPTLHVRNNNQDCDGGCASQSPLEKTSPWKRMLNFISPHSEQLIPRTRRPHCGWRMVRNGSNGCEISFTLGVKFFGQHGFTQNLVQMAFADEQAHVFPVRSQPLLQLRDF